jgi:pectate lyase
MHEFNSKAGTMKLSAIALGLAVAASPALAASITSLGADGWASVGVNNLGQAGTTGGQGAMAVKTYTVRDRNGLIQALYGNTAIIKADGSFSGTLDNSKKVIYVAGTINLNMNKALVELSGDDHIAAANASSAACASVGFSTYDAWWSAYLAAYKPPYATVPTGAAESARACGANQQRKITRVTVPSNTSLIGVGASARIINGGLLLSGTGSATPVDNIVIRNIAFENAFDFFPQWDPTDSGGRWNSAYDNIGIQYATHVWIDHNTFSDGAGQDHLYPSVWAAPYDGPLYEVQHHDGLVDVTGSANYVTLSNNHFHDHNKTTLIGGTDTASLTESNPRVLKTTLHHNYYQNVVQRQPRVRYGMVHIYSNYYTGENGGAEYGWSVGWTSGQGSKIYAENNVFDITGKTAAVGGKVISASPSASAVTNCAKLAGMSTQYCSAYVYDTGTVLNGVSVNASDAVRTLNALITPSATPWPSAASPTTAPSATPASYYSYNIGATTGLATSVPVNAGVGKL